MQRDSVQGFSRKQNICKYQEIVKSQANLRALLKVQAFHGISGPGASSCDDLFTHSCCGWLTEGWGSSVHVGACGIKCNLWILFMLPMQLQKVLSDFHSQTFAFSLYIFSQTQDLMYHRLALNYRLCSSKQPWTSDPLHPLNSGITGLHRHIQLYQTFCITVLRMKPRTLCIIGIQLYP